jgi:hypothetical protein
MIVRKVPDYGYNAGFGCLHGCIADWQLSFRFNQWLPDIGEYQILFIATFPDLTIYFSTIRSYQEQTDHRPNLPVTNFTSLLSGCSFTVAFNSFRILQHLFPERSSCLRHSNFRLLLIGEAWLRPFFKNHNQNKRSTTTRLLLFVATGYDLSSSMV